MTVLRCLKCDQYWTVHTLHPQATNITHLFCPACIEATIPTINLDTRRAS